MKINRLALLFGGAFCLSIFFSCQNESSSGETVSGGSGKKVTKSFDSSDSEHSMDKLDKAKKIFFMIPSPIETVTILKRAGAHYTGSDLNAPTNSSKYTTVGQKALNLGVYGADLSFASVFDQTQETMFFIKAAKSCAEGIGVMEAFGPSTVDRIEANIDDSDSMSTIISDCYWTADAHLKEEGSESVSAMIIVGGWVEGLHLACSVYRRNPENADIRKRILEQKYSLKHLVQLVESFDQEDSNVKMVKSDLDDLKGLYDELKVQVMKEEEKKKKDQNVGVMTIGGKREIVASDDQINAILEKVDVIRTKYIS